MTIPRMAFDWSLPAGWQTRVDTVLHAAVSCALVLALAVWRVHPLAACGAVLVIGVGKEGLWDWYLGYGDGQLTDMIGDVAGILAAFLVLAGA